MIILITGVPGSFKTLFALDLLTKSDFLGRSVYSNIDGSSHSPIPNDDWRETPEGSLVIYDEAQTFFPSSGKSGLSSDPRVIALDQHRHSGHDIIFITQRYTLIHHHIRNFVGRHYHLVRKSKSLATLYTNGEVFNPDDKKMIKTVTTSLFTAPVSLFTAYKSSSLHTKVQTGIRLPRWVWVALIIFFIGVYFVYRSGSSFITQSTSTASSSIKTVSNSAPIPSASSFVPSPATFTPPSSAPNSTPDAPNFVKTGYLPLKGCIASASSCQCYDSSGNPVLLTPDLCTSAVASHGYITLAVSDDTHSDTNILHSSKPVNFTPPPALSPAPIPSPLPAAPKPLPPSSFYPSTSTTLNR